MKEIFEDKRRVFLLLLILIGTIEPFIFPMQAEAVSSTGFVRLDRLGSGATTTSGTVCLNTQAVGTENGVVVTFPGTTGTAGASVYGINQTASSWTVTTTNLPKISGTTATAWPGIATATTVSGGAVTFPSTDLTANTWYCFNFASVLSLPTGANNNLTGSIATTVSAGATTTINYALSNVASNNDQVTVTASVTPTFSFALGANTAALGNLPTSGAPSTATAITATISTNAQNGAIIWAKDANANSALTSASTSDGICLGGNYPTCTGAAYQATGSNVHSLSGAAGYGLSAAAGSGAPTIAAEYAGSATSFGSLDSTKFEQISSFSAPVSAGVTNLTFGAEASATNKAASDYTDTVTVTAAGEF